MREFLASATFQDWETPASRSLTPCSLRFFINALVLMVSCHIFEMRSSEKPCLRYWDIRSFEKPTPESVEPFERERDELPPLPLLDEREAEEEPRRMRTSQ